MNFINSLYIHFPYCKHLCNYCDFYKIKTSSDDFSSYENYLEMAFLKLKELSFQENYEFSSFDTLYLGGGTPSLWGEKGAQYFEKFFQKFDLSFSTNPECTLEINPGVWTKEGLDSWENWGVNRFSLGAQTLNSTLLKWLDRYHSLDETYLLLDELKSRNANFSVDFMLGIPQDVGEKRNLEKELTDVLSYNPSHLSLYILTSKKGYKWASKIPQEDKIAEEYLFVSSFLKERGFQHYEVSNFGKPHYESRHNLKYWSSQTVAALGPSSTGYFAESGLRYKWSQKWANSDASYSTELLNQFQKKLELFYLQLRMGCLKDIQFFFPEEEKERAFKNCLTKWEKEGLLCVGPASILLTSKGLLMMDSIIDEVFSLKLL